jgi:hypothetical protein
VYNCKSSSAITVAASRVAVKGVQMLKGLKIVTKKGNSKRE